MNLIDALNWRYATKVFDKNKKISQNDLNEILEVFRLSASSFGLQPWKIIIVENPDLRQKLLPVSWNQTQVVDASHLLVLARVENAGDKLIDEHLNNVVKTRGVTKEDLSGYESMMKNFLNGKSGEEKNAWATRQVNIALGNVLTFLASRNIDSCPMEGFDPNAYDEILGLKKLGIASSIVLPIGYRSEDDKYAKAKKVRFDIDDIVVKM